MTDLSLLLQQLPENFRASPLWKAAFTHKSFHFENKDSLAHNERLEFLGDAALDLVVAKILYLSFPEKDEGFLTKARAQLVNTGTLSEKAKDLQLEALLKIGRSEKNQENVLPPRLLASTLEALLGAVYLELGEEKLTEIIKKIFEEELQSEEKLSLRLEDWKSSLQEELQKEFQKTPTYKLVKAEGPDHQRKFFVQVIFEDQVLGEGEGLSRKQAEQMAAKQALEEREKKDDVL
jgi:ribonuclease-3